MSVSIHPSRHILIAVFLIAIASVALMSCGGDSTTTPEDNGADEPRVLDVSLGESVGSPAGRVAIDGIPQDVEWAYAFVTVPGAAASTTGGAEAAQETFGIAFIRREAGGDSLVVPVHPIDPMAGGTVEIEITNGTTITSNKVTLEIEALEPAPGAFAAMVSDLEALHDSWIAHHNTTEGALRATTADQLSPLEMQLLLFHGVIDHPDNPNSLKAFAAGDIPLMEDDVVERDVLDAVAALSGIDGMIADKASFVDTLTAPDTTAQAIAATAPRRATRRQVDCVTAPTFDIGPSDCYKLADVMSYRAELDFEKNSAVQKLQDDAIDSITSLLGYAKGAVLAWGITNTVWAADNIQDGSRGVYPSQFVSDATTFTATPEVFPEDFTEPGNWSRFLVTATSTGWRFDDVIKDAFKKAKGLKGGFGEKSVDGLIGDASRGKYVDKAVKKMESSIKNPVWNKAKDELGIDEMSKLEYCAQTWPNIDCTGKPFSEGSSPDLEVNSDALTYKPSEVGTTTLEIMTSSIFGLVTPTAETKPIETRRIELFIDPFQATAGTDETVDFSVRVENAENQEVEWYPGEEGPAPQGFEPNDKQLAVMTPSDPWSPAIVIKVRSLSNTGLRENMVNSDPREDSAPIEFADGSVTVSPSFVCLTPNEPQTFAAEVSGVDDKSVTWTWEGVGSMNGATYTAPSTAGGEATITATSVENPDLKGYALVVVAGCECSWGARIQGDFSAFWSGDFAAWTDGQSGGFSSIQLTGIDSPNPIITGTISAPITAGVTGTFDLLSLQIFDGTIESSYVGPVEGEDVPQIIISSNDGVKIKGTITGVLGAGTMAEPKLVTVSAGFEAAEIMSNGGSPCTTE